MQEIVARLQASGEFEVKPFGDDVILNKPVEDWPRCDCLLSWHSDGFPLQKAQAYASLRRPYLINDVHMQDLLLDRRAVYSKLQASGIPVPKHIVVDREGLPRPPPGMVTQYSSTMSPAASSSLAAGEEKGGEEVDSEAAAAAAARKSDGKGGKVESSPEGDGDGTGDVPEPETETDAETDEIADPNPIKRSKNSDLTEGGGTHRTNNDVSGGGYHGDYIPLQEVIDTVDRMLNRIFDWEAKPVAAYKFPVKGEVKEKTGYNKVNKLTEFLLYGTADNPKIVSKSGHALWHIIMAAKPSGVSWATHSEGITDDDVVYLKIRLDPGYSFNDIVEKFLEFIRSYNFSQEYRKKPKPPKPPKPPKKDRQTYDYK